MTSRTALVLLAFFPSLLACPRAAPAPAAAAPPTRLSWELLDALDERKPVPLFPKMAYHQKEEMRENLEAVQAIVAALAVDDFAAVETSAKRLGYVEEEAQESRDMGTAAPGFADHAISFFRQGDKIAEAARAKDRTRTIEELSATLQLCTSCHATWKQRVVTEAEWSKLSGAAAPRYDDDTD